MKRKLLDRTTGPGVDPKTGLDRFCNIRVYSDHSARLVVSGHVDDVWWAYLKAFADDPEAEWQEYLDEKQTGVGNE